MEKLFMNSSQPLHCSQHAHHPEGVPSSWTCASMAGSYLVTIYLGMPSFYLSWKVTFLITCWLALPFNTMNAILVSLFSVVFNENQARDGPFSCWLYIFPVFAFQQSGIGVPACGSRFSTQGLLSFFCVTPETRAIFTRYPSSISASFPSFLFWNSHCMYTGAFERKILPYRPCWTCSLFFIHWSMFSEWAVSIVPSSWFCFRRVSVFFRRFLRRVSVFFRGFLRHVSVVFWGFLRHVRVFSQGSLRRVSVVFRDFSDVSARSSRDFALHSVNLSV